MDLFNLKSNTIENINSLFELYFAKEKEFNNNNQDYVYKIKSLTEINDKLIGEISEKDKIIIIKEKTINDYEKQILELTNIREEEEDSKERSSMIKALHKTISEYEKTISNLTKQNETLKNKNNKLEEDNKILSESTNNLGKITEIIDDNHKDDCKEKEQKILNDTIEKSLEDIPPNIIDDAQIAAGLNASLQDGEIYNTEIENELSSNENKSSVENIENIENIENDDSDNSDDDENILPDGYLIFTYKEKKYCIKDIETPKLYYELSDTYEVGEKVGVFKFINWSKMSKNGEDFISLEDKDEKIKYIFKKGKDNILGEKIGIHEGKSRIPLDK